jgi:hypothetical protein
VGLVGTFRGAADRTALTRPETSGFEGIQQQRGFVRSIAMVPSNSRSRESGVVELCNAEQFTIHIGIDYLPAVYVGRLLANLGQLYEEVTGDVMILCEASPGSLTLRLRACISDKLKPFIAILRGIFRHLDKEKVTEITSENLNAIAKKLPNQAMTSSLEQEKLRAEIQDLKTKTQIGIISGLPKFASDMVDLAIKIDPQADPQRLERIASLSMRTYVDLFGIDAQRSLTMFSGQESLQQVDHLKDRFKLEYRSDDDESLSSA